MARVDISGLRFSFLLWSKSDVLMGLKHIKLGRVRDGKPHQYSLDPQGLAGGIGEAGRTIKYRNAIFYKM